MGVTPSSHSSRGAHQRRPRRLRRSTTANDRVLTHPLGGSVTISRRRFLERGAVGAAAAAAAAAGGMSLARTAQAESAPDRLASVRRAFAGPPTVVASANGLRGVAKAYEMMTQGADPLDAAIAGVNIQELDPNDHSVGLGGLPNQDGVAPR